MWTDSGVPGTVLPGGNRKKDDMALMCIKINLIQKCITGFSAFLSEETTYSFLLMAQVYHYHGQLNTWRDNAYFYSFFPLLYVGSVKLTIKATEASVAV